MSEQQPTHDTELLAPAEPLHSIEEGDVLERLVDAGRIPSGFIKMDSVDSTTKTFTPGFFFFIPPVGTQPGDVLSGSLLAGDEIVVTSPSGEIRGPAEMLHATPSQAGRIRGRVMMHYYSKTPNQ